MSNIAHAVGVSLLVMILFLTPVTFFGLIIQKDYMIKKENMFVFIACTTVLVGLAVFLLNL